MLLLVAAAATYTYYACVNDESELEIFLENRIFPLEFVDRNTEQHVNWIQII